jgi:hypothetical protein
MSPTNISKKDKRKNHLQNEDFHLKIEACEKFHRRHIVDIPRIKF